VKDVGDDDDQDDDDRSLEIEDELTKQGAAGPLGRPLLSGAG
jgi:hypothetical protein